MDNNFTRPLVAGVGDSVVITVGQVFVRLDRWLAKEVAEQIINIVNNGEDILHDLDGPLPNRDEDPDDTPNDFN